MCQLTACLRPLPHESNDGGRRQLRKNPLKMSPKEPTLRCSLNSFNNKVKQDMTPTSETSRKC